MQFSNLLKKYYDEVKKGESPTSFINKQELSVELIRKLAVDLERNYYDSGEIIELYNAGFSIEGDNLELLRSFIAFCMNVYLLESSRDFADRVYRGAERLHSHMASSDSARILAQVMYRYYDIHKEGELCSCKLKVLDLLKFCGYDYRICYTLICCSLSTKEYKEVVYYSALMLDQGDDKLKSWERVDLRRMHFISLYRINRNEESLLVFDELYDFINNCDPFDVVDLTDVKEILKEVSLVRYEKLNLFLSRLPY